MLIDLPCPSCGEGVVSLELKLFARGEAFVCNACGASLAVASDSQQAMGQGVERFEEFQDRVGALRGPVNPSR